MSVSPIITFKAGRCEVDTSSRPYKVTPDPTPGYVYLYSEDELVHFCWRERGKPMIDEDNLDLVMFPTDGHFEPYEYKTSDQPTSKTNGRIFALKFQSSSQRHLFWMQSKPQARNGDASWFSPRDLKIGQIVDTLLQGEEVNVTEEISQVRGGNSGNDDGDETMEDVEGQGDSAEHHRGGSGGAGPDATGGDIREEGSGAREGGADGGRAAGSGPQDAATVVQNFLNSLKGGMPQQQAQGQVYTTLPDLLPSSATIPMIDSASPAQIDNLLGYLPPTILLIAQESAASIDGMVEPNAETATAAMEALSIEQKKAILKRVLRSPQFHQSLGSLTMAIRDGGLPSIAEALGIRLQNGGLVRGGSVPLGGRDAVEAFVEGVKKTVEEKK
ncbi:Proteasomal ubiquitin receptor ADRM1-like protein [Lachnellula suecica]|uniref:Proteasomal ubiquitin receptor ADRM1-like protein n=1 Tax=Lachnellula suecica TaxID=602035 RepID=A0A8T9CAR0_9HELO|nr:Proteasomal ubiquitin receptor ADRM1-like protein [Lachnellula suecica]